LTGVVVDASTALAWCFPDETSDYADHVLVSMEGKTMLVPAVWGLEIANAMLAGERQKRLTHPDVRRFLSLIENLDIVQDGPPVGQYLGQVLPLAREHGLSAYDAAYLELSIRHRAPLASLDRKLQKAAKKAGVAVFAGEAA
jgi:predicted nucleic acid-binding protein